MAPAGGSWKLVWDSFVSCYCPCSGTPILPHTLENQHTPRSHLSLVAKGCPEISALSSTVLKSCSRLNGVAQVEDESKSVSLRRCCERGASGLHEIENPSHSGLGLLAIRIFA